VKIYIFLLLGLLPGVAFAHSFYSAACCSTYDCAPVPVHAVQITDEGYVVTLYPGEHPMVKDGVFISTVPYGSELRSEDQDFHACVVPSDAGVIRCLYVPLMGY
jgi:hypothetical protein